MPAEKTVLLDFVILTMYNHNASVCRDAENAAAREYSCHPEEPEGRRGDLVAFVHHGSTAGEIATSGCALLAMTEDKSALLAMTEDKSALQ